MKRILKITLAALCLLSPPGLVVAQNNPVNPKQAGRSLSGLSRIDKQRNIRAMRNAHPLLFKQLTVAPRILHFPSASQRIRGIAKKVDASTGGYNATMWANICYLPEWEQERKNHYGYYSFTPASPVTFTQMGSDMMRPIASNGVQLADNGHLYGVYLDLTYLANGTIYVYLNDYDTDTWTGTTSNMNPNDLSFVATETAQAYDGTVYGEFYNADATGLELGTVDYLAQTRYTIAPTTKFYMAMGITRAGQLYGIAADGNLYRIDKVTGTETLVGPTGLTLTNSDGQYYGQTGEIDQSDDTFYWLARDINGNSGLYTVNLQTGAATKIADEDAQAYGLLIPSPAPQAGAPAKATNIRASFQGTSLDGTISFTAPTNMYGGGTLSGDLDYTIVAGNDTLARGTTTPGERVNSAVTVPENGMYTFLVTTSNAAGTSPLGKVSRYVGYDTPLPVTKLQAAVDGQDVNLSWKAPEIGIHNGIIGTLTYDVYRIANGTTTKIASDITENSFTDHITSSKLTSYTYGVRAKAENQESAMTTSRSVAIGDGIDPSWSTNFDKAGDFALFTVLDANDDQVSWTYDESDDGGTVNSFYSKTNGNDDWLFTPPFHLVPNRIYKVSFSAKNGFSYDTYANTLEVKYGSAMNPDGMTATLLATTQLPGDWTKYSYEINVPTEGKYFIGFHDNTSEANHGYISIDSVSVEKAKLLSSPGAVTSLTVTPAAEGALKADISFNVPTTTISGSQLAGVDSIQIRRDSIRIATLLAKNAGEAITYTDDAVPTNGNHTYEVVPYIDDEAGQSASASAYIGQDIPPVPSSVVLSDNGQNILANWQAFTTEGGNGGYVDPARVAVSFFKAEQGDDGLVIGDSVTTSSLGATSAAIAYDPSQTTAKDGSTQALFYLAARADGDAGQSDYTTTSSVVVGNPLALPYHESSAGAKLDNGFAWLEGNEQFKTRDDAAGWICTSASSDGDGGSLLWAPYEEGDSWFSTYVDIAAGDEVSINTPKIALGGAAQPKLYFYVNGTDDDQAHLKVLVATPDGTDHEAADYDMASIGEEWQLKSIDLSSYSSYPYIIVKFRGVASGDNVSIGIDDINIFDQKEKDVAATAITVPENATAGKQAKVDVSVRNFGVSDASGFSVILYADNQPVDTAIVSESLSTMAIDTVSLSAPVAINQSADLNVFAKVVLNGDLNPANDTTATKAIKVTPSQYSSVNDLSATSVDGGATLSWSKPAAPDPVTVTEDFESYKPFVTQFGDWTLIDGDKCTADGFFDDFFMPNEGEPFAFEIFNASRLTDQYNVLDNEPGYAAHSGAQFAAAPRGWDETGSLGDADNWLISPLLSGRQQTIKFYAYNISSPYVAYAENFEVLYSNGTDPADTASFVCVDSCVADGTSTLSDGPNWKEFSAVIPEGANYFAIHHSSSYAENYMFGLDDIEFEKAAAGVNDSIIAYNIYRDGQLIGTVEGSDLTFTDHFADGANHIYNVTAVYQSRSGETNESGFSNDASVVSTAIAGIKTNANSLYDIYTIDGKTVRLGAKTLSGLHRGLYIINGRKCLIK